MKVKTSELTGAALDWAVAKAEGMSPHAFVEHDYGQGSVRSLSKWCGVCVTPSGHVVYAPSADWAQGGPIIDCEGIGFFCNMTADQAARFKNANADWRAFAYNKHGTHYYGPTALIAVMRCYVASKLGDTVDIPEELL